MKDDDKEAKARRDKEQRELEKKALEEQKQREEQAASLAKTHAEGAEAHADRVEANSKAAAEQAQQRIDAEQKAAEDRVAKLAGAEEKKAPKAPEPPDYGDLDQIYTLLPGNWIAGRFEGRATVRGGEIVNHGLNPKLLWERGDIFVHPDHMPGKHSAKEAKAE